MEVPNSDGRSLNAEELSDLCLCEYISAAEVPSSRGAELFQKRGFSICNSSVIDVTSLQNINLPLPTLECPLWWEDPLNSPIASPQTSLMENLYLAKPDLNHNSCLKNILLEGGLQGNPGPTRQTLLVPFTSGKLRNWSNIGDHNAMWSFWPWCQSLEFLDICFETSKDGQSFVAFLEETNFGQRQHWFLAVIRFATLFYFLDVLASGLGRSFLIVSTHTVPVASGSAEDCRNVLSVLTSLSMQSELLMFLVLVKLNVFS